MFTLFTVTYISKKHLKKNPTAFISTKNNTTCTCNQTSPKNLVSSSSNVLCNNEYYKYHSKVSTNAKTWHRVGQGELKAAGAPLTATWSLQCVRATPAVTSAPVLNRNPISRAAPQRAGPRRGARASPRQQELDSGWTLPGQLVTRSRQLGSWSPDSPGLGGSPLWETQ